MKEASRKMQLGIVAISLGIALSISWVQNSPNQQVETMALSDPNIPFVMNYEVENGVLIYNYWSDNGLLTQETDIRVFQTNVDDVKISNNNIYIKGELKKLPKSTKKQAVIINNNTLIYLSDLGRGYGFYRLIKISL